MKKTVISLLILVFCLGMVSGVIAATTTKKIQADLNYGITLKYNGAVKVFKDINGNVMYPISYNGTTYLPLRGVASLFNTPIEWVEEKQTIHLGTESTKAITQSMFSTMEGFTYSTDKSKLVIGKKQYDSGLVCSRDNSSKVSSFTLKLPTAYDTLHFKILCDAQQVFKIYNPNKEVIKTFTCKPGEPLDIEVDIKGLEFIQMLSKDEWDNDKKSNIIIADMKLK